METRSLPSTSTTRYDVAEVLGAGGMGVIHRAHDRLADRDVAYKRLRVSMELDRPRLGALFRREYDTLARLHHPNIVSVYDFGYDELGAYYTMELLPGDDLAKLAPLSVAEACRVLRDVASALALIHARRLLHRDVSPSNVRLSSNGQAKLLDFGALTPFGRPNEVVGTPAFIAPECLTTEPLDARADLYALGALAYWTLTRRLAVRAYSLDELSVALTLPLVPPSAHVPQIPRELDDLVLSLLSHDKNARPRTAAEVIERLTNLAELAPERDEAEVAESYLHHAPLFGRASAIDDMRLALDLVRAGRGSVLVLNGAPGMGKSAMLAQLSVEAQLRGATVLRAEGKVHTGAFGLVSQLVQTGLAIYADLAQTAQRRGSLMVTAGTIAPEAGGARSAFEAAERHARIAASMQDVLLQLALRGPLVLVIDDAHLADEQSVALLAAMADSIARHPILLALTRLSGPPTSASISVLCATANKIALSPLSQAEVGELAGSMFGDVPNVERVARWLYEESRGEPSACLRLSRVLLTRGQIRYGRGTFVLPRELLGGLLLELERTSQSSVGDLPDDVSQLAQLLSLQDGALRFDQLVFASRLSSQATFVALHELTERGLLLEAADRYSLTSQTLRATLAASMTEAHRCRVELALARTLLRDPNPTLATRFAAGLHMIHAGAEHELTGAEIITTATSENSYEVALSGMGARYLEAALAVCRAHGDHDAELLDLLIPLSAMGFYGDLGAQQRHLVTTMHTLYALTGMTLATKLRRWVGAKLALVIGIVVALVVRPFRSARVKKRSFAQHLEGMISITSTGVASTVTVLDVAEATRIVGWLEPFADAAPHGPLQVPRQFCLAVLEVVQGRLVSATRRLEDLLAVLRSPVRGMKELTREQLLRGAVNSLAIATLERDPARSNQAIEELAGYGGFFAPHAALLRAMYHAHRGELDDYEQQRARTEALALLGGVSWSALALLTTQEHLFAVQTENTILLLRVVAELERIANLSEGLTRQRDFARADLLLLRRRPAEACTAYEAVLGPSPSVSDYYGLAACAMYARALRENSQIEAAKRVCEEALARFVWDELSGTLVANALVQQLALAEAELGGLERARALLDEQLALPVDPSPLRLGSLHRDRALVALLEKDEPAFEQHFAEMKRLFKSVHNPWLLQQCDGLLTRAVRSGMRPAVSPYELTAIESSSEEMDGTTVLGDERSPQADNDVRAATPPAITGVVDHTADDQHTRKQA